jgi:hypothetical protein
MNSSKIRHLIFVFVPGYSVNFQDSDQDALIFWLDTNQSASFGYNSKCDRIESRRRDGEHGRVSLLASRPFETLSLARFGGSLTLPATVQLISSTLPVHPVAL